MAPPAATTACAAAGVAIGASLLVSFLRRKPPVQIRRSVSVPGIGTVPVKAERYGGKTHLTLDFKTLLGIQTSLPFCSAVVTDGGTVYVSGAVGATKGSDGKPTIVPGGPEKEAIQTLRIIEASLQACGAGFENVTMVHAYLVDYSTERFNAMNKGYMEVLGSQPLPARICTGTSHVGLQGSVEMDAIAQL
mmetsp:Transcript_44660/g.83395  ORF Transcript_44660/g.83395 Transcript_44660/m.83395 type:complete len:191 (-) Transcript_44660:44-616(-)